MRIILACLFILPVHFAFAEMQGSACGLVKGFSYNHDTIERPYQLSGFFLKQNTKDIRITYGNNPNFIDFVESLESHQLFICLDKYTTIEKSYAGRARTYAIVEEFRIWVEGKLVE